MSMISNRLSTEFADNLPESSDELQAAVSAERQQLKRSLDQLGSAVREKVDVKSRLRENPLVTVGAAFAAGLVLGVLSNKATRSADTTSSAFAPSKYRRPSRPGLGSSFGHMASTIAALVGQRLATVAEDSVRNALKDRRTDRTPAESNNPQ